MRIDVRYRIFALYSGVHHKEIERGKHMITLNIFQKNDKVLVKGIVSEVTVDENGVHKYRIKDGKSGLTFGTWYTGDEIVAEEPKGEEDED